MPASHPEPGAPLSVEQIARQAGAFEFDPATPLRYWLRSAKTLLKEVCYAQELHQLPLPPVVPT